MFYLVGLKDNGKLALCDRMARRPGEEELERFAIAFHYVQMLLFDDSTLNRYEYDTMPRLREVPHFG